MDGSVADASVTKMVRNFRPDDDEGLTVKTASGDTVGTIEKIDGTMAHVKPESGLSSSIRNRLGWTKDGEEVYELKHSKVDTIDDEVILKD